MAGKVFNTLNAIGSDSLAKEISSMYDTYNSQRNSKINDWVELRGYLFATDTSKTTNSKLPWKNKTTRPKLTQIRDNLSANYMSALFPNDDWLRWEGKTLESESRDKRNAILAYMSNKIKLSKFRQVVQQLLLDYIDYGNCFADVEYVREYSIDKDGNKVPNYIGPKAVRISPLDIVFNPLADSFKNSPKITRTLKSYGELKREIELKLGTEYLNEIFDRSDSFRSHASSFTTSDWAKAKGYTVDGFGSLQEYYGSGLVEILEFEGDIFDTTTGEYHHNRLITVIDRRYVIRNINNPSWLSGGTKVHAGWRKRPDTLWAMGPLDNIVGMQYRIDHLENLKADAMDLAVFPPLVITGNVEEFNYGPLEEIYVGEGGSVQELGRNLNGVITANNEIALLEAKMEELAGSPRETMGIRTAGEKTAYEVQQLLTAAGRMFQEKLTNFEVDVLEPLLNAMLEISVRNLDSVDVIRVMDDDYGIFDFLSITKEDITAEGILRPVGARHFTAQSMLLQNLTGVFNSQIGQVIMPHISSMKLAKMVEDVVGLERYALFSENAKIYEEVDRQRLVQTAQENLAVEATEPGLSG